MAVKPDAAMGYRTGAKFLLIFMFAFFLLGYSYILSIALGAIAGLSSGFMAAWWNAKEDFFTEEETAKAERSQTGDDATGGSLKPRALRYGFGVKLAKDTRSDRQQQQSKGSWWFLRRKR